MTFESVMENIALAFEAVGVAIIAVGGIVALVRGRGTSASSISSSRMSAADSVAR
jgi:hypothetical protein